jgi:hypothetical protein
LDIKMNDMHICPMLRDLWIIPVAAFLLLGFGATFVRRPRIRRAILGIAIAFVVPFPVFSPDGAIIIPICMLLGNVTTLWVGLVSVGIMGTILYPIACLTGWLYKQTRKNMKGVVQQ